MQTLYVLLAIYLVFSLFRIMYQIIVGFLYVSPARKNVDKSYNPLVTIIIPAWNESVGISKTLKSVMSGTYKNIEIIVIDDGSTDNTREIALKTRNRYYRNKYKIQIHSQRNSGKAEALNSGISLAKGELIVSLDADSFLMKNSIKELVLTMSNLDYCVAMGEVVVGNTKSLVGKLQHYEYLIGFHFKRSQHILNSAYIFPGALTMFRTSVLKEVGRFESYSSTEDLDISMKIKHEGHKVAYVDSATCITEGAVSLRGLVNQRTRWRHGFLDCIIHRKEFVWSSSKGKYLTYIDFPLSIIGVVEVLVYPLVLAFLIYQISINPLAPVIVLSYIFLPFVFFLLNSLRGGDKSSFKTLLIMPVALSIINIVEFIALIKSIYRVLAKKKTTWTVWQRTGAN